MLNLAVLLSTFFYTDVSILRKWRKQHLWKRRSFQNCKLKLISFIQNKTTQILHSKQSKQTKTVKWTIQMKVHTVFVGVISCLSHNKQTLTLICKHVLWISFLLYLLRRPTLKIVSDNWILRWFCLTIDFWMITYCL